MDISQVLLLFRMFVAEDKQIAGRQKTAGARKKHLKGKPVSDDAPPPVFSIHPASKKADNSHRS